MRATSVGPTGHQSHKNQGARQRYEVLCGTLIIMVPWDQKHKLPWPPEPGSQEMSPGWQLQRSRHQKKKKISLLKDTGTLKHDKGREKI